MFEHFDERARRCVVLAEQEARRIGHEELGTVHLLLGVAAVAPDLIGLDVEPLRASVVALHGSSPARPGDGLPISTETKAALEGANARALALGHTTIDPAHLLLAVLDAGGGAARALREAGAPPGAVRERATAAAGSGQTAAAGGVDGPSTAAGDADDAALLALVLRKNGAVARLLREHGIDEQRLREAFGPDADLPLRG
jgi:ATP-dependent Clp protease ATP-binding subunit ClpC